MELISIAFFLTDYRSNDLSCCCFAGTVTRFAGSGAGNVDGAAASAKFYYPNGLALTSDGTMLVADYWNNVFRAISTAGEFMQRNCLLCF